MQTLLTLDVARDAVAQQFATPEDETALALAATPAPSIRGTRTRLAGALHRFADTVAPRPTGSYRTAH